MHSILLRRYGLSYRELDEIMHKRGVAADQSLPGNQKRPPREQPNRRSEPNGFHFEPVSESHLQKGETLLLLQIHLMQWCQLILSVSFLRNQISVDC